MVERENLEGLLARVRAATGSDRELDYDLWAGVDPEGVASTARTECLALPWPEWRAVHARDRFTGDNHQPVTASLDAALALVERVLPACCPQVSQHVAPKPHWKVVLRSWERAHTAGAPTAPLAVLAALLSALVQNKDRGDAV